MRVLSANGLALESSRLTVRLRIWRRAGAGRNEEVGAVAAFLASPAAAHIIGDVIHVNGGMLFGS